ncbi:hypothetical protein [uncultured Microbacterium sp.]|uniref:Uncharacterized protein n=1 Tax=uncultured Microbacterium sp. TaxID=191216 RepID=A0A1Y5P2A7_9MICO|nr:hypothetical protein [uncultured Microbacterium sp.]SBS71459.1 hypothetical protein MIPYR_20019 [uncultured Microbacterium sp.]
MVVPLAIVLVGVLVAAGQLGAVLDRGPERLIQVDGAEFVSDRSCIELTGSAEQSLDYPLWIWVRDKWGTHRATEVADWTSATTWRTRTTLTPRVLPVDTNYTITLLYLPREQAELLRSIRGGDGAVGVLRLPPGARGPASVSFTRTAGDGGPPC